MFHLLGNMNFTSPSALPSDGAWLIEKGKFDAVNWVKSTALRSMSRPCLSTILRCPAALGFFCSIGRYSLTVIERGTFQVGLTTMNSIRSENSGLRVSGRFWPTTVTVSKVSRPSSITFAVKSGRLTQMWRCPSGTPFIQRNRSIATSTERRRSSGSRLISAIVPSPAIPSDVIPLSI